MVMILERGQRQNSIWCFTKFDKFYPICYTDIVGQSTLIADGDGEPNLDPKSAAQVLLASRTSPSGARLGWHHRSLHGRIVQLVTVWPVLRHQGDWGGAAGRSRLRRYAV